MLCDPPTHTGTHTHTTCTHTLERTLGRTPLAHTPTPHPQPCTNPQGYWYCQRVEGTRPRRAATLTWCCARSSTRSCSPATLKALALGVSSSNASRPTTRPTRLAHEASRSCTGSQTHVGLAVIKEMSTMLCAHACLRNPPRCLMLTVLSRQDEAWFSWNEKFQRGFTTSRSISDCPSSATLGKCRAAPVSAGKRSETVGNGRNLTFSRVLPQGKCKSTDVVFGTVDCGPLARQTVRTKTRRCTYHRPQACSLLHTAGCRGFSMGATELPANFHCDL